MGGRGHRQGGARKGLGATVCPQGPMLSVNPFLCFSLGQHLLPSRKRGNCLGFESELAYISIYNYMSVTLQECIDVPCAHVCGCGR